MVITLIGYRGSGKSSVAAPLADALSWDWVDADDEIEQKAGCTIREIFERDGELRFRELEEEVLEDLLSRDKLVIAAGGGAVLSETTRQRIKQAGPVIWLKASVETLASRINADKTTAERRPDLTSTGGRNEIEEMLSQRELLYRDCSTAIIDTDGLSVDEIVTSILDSVGQKLQGGNTSRDDR